MCGLSMCDVSFLVLRVELLVMVCDLHVLLLSAVADWDSCCLIHWMPNRSDCWQMKGLLCNRGSVRFAVLS